MYIKWIRRGLVLCLIAVSSVTVFLVVDTVSAQASSNRRFDNPANYSLVQDVFEFRSSPHILTLQFRGEPITRNIVEWHVVGVPAGVASASVTRVDGENVFRFAGMAPQPQHMFNVVATVMEADRPIITIQLTVLIRNSDLV
jgi:hypothetical protein